jgi:hypothetical protein
MNAPQLSIKDLVLESQYVLWTPRIHPGKVIEVRDSEDLLSLPRAFMVCFFPENFLDIQAEVEPLMWNILKAIHYWDVLVEFEKEGSKPNIPGRSTLIVFGQRVLLSSLADRVCRRSGAQVALGFGVKLEELSVQSAHTLPLDEVIKNPLLKKQVWEDVRSLYFQAA